MGSHGQGVSEVNCSPVFCKTDAKRVHNTNVRPGVHGCFRFEMRSKIFHETTAVNFLDWVGAFAGCVLRPEEGMRRVENGNCSEDGCQRCEELYVDDRCCRR